MENLGLLEHHTVSGLDQVHLDLGDLGGEEVGVEMYQAVIMKNQLDCEGSLLVKDQLNFQKPLNGASDVSLLLNLLLLELVGHPTVERLHGPVSLCSLGETVQCTVSFVSCLVGGCLG